MFLTSKPPRRKTHQWLPQRKGAHGCHLQEGARNRLPPLNYPQDCHPSTTSKSVAANGGDEGQVRLFAKNVSNCYKVGRLVSTLQNLVSFTSQGTRSASRDAAGGWFAHLLSHKEENAALAFQDNHTMVQHFMPPTAASHGRRQGKSSFSCSPPSSSSQNRLLKEEDGRRGGLAAVLPLAHKAAAAQGGGGEKLGS